MAIVGAGIAGLSAAWLLSQTHRVTIYDKNGHAGGHANTVDVEGTAVDTGFIVYNERNYPNLVALFDTLGVPTKPSVMSFAVSLRDGALEYSSADLNRFLGQRSNLANPRFWRMARDILRFYRHAQGLSGNAVPAITLGAYLKENKYSDALIEDHILPMCAAIWSTTADEITHYPLAAFVRFFSSHGLFDISGNHQWRTVDGGSRVYVERLLAAFDHEITLKCGVRQVARRPEGVTVVDERGETRSFDEVVIAAHADEALAMLADADQDEHRLLGAFRYTQNTAYLHNDPALMPKRRKVWSSWNYIGDGASEEALCVSYWMNNLQSLDERTPLFVTLNPHRPLPDHAVKGVYQYSHPFFSAEALAAQEELWRIQGQRHTWFCGSYCGYGFHEDALQAGLHAAELLGGVRRPWNVAGESDRIIVAPQPAAEAAE